MGSYSPFPHPRRALCPSPNQLARLVRLGGSELVSQRTFHGSPLSRGSPCRSIHLPAHPSRREPWSAPQHQPGALPYVILVPGTLRSATLPQAGRSPCFFRFRPVWGTATPPMPSCPPTLAAHRLNTSGETLCSWPLCWGSHSTAPRNRSPSPNPKQQPRQIPHLHTGEYPGWSAGHRGIPHGSVST